MPRRASTLGLDLKPVLSHTSQVLARRPPGGMKREHQCRPGARRSAQFVLTTALPSSATASLGLYPQLCIERRTRAGGGSPLPDRVTPTTIVGTARRGGKGSRRAPPSTVGRRSLGTARGFDEPGDLPVCVTRIPTAIADSLTANNLRDQRLVARLPRSWPRSSVRPLRSGRRSCPVRPSCRGRGGVLRGPRAAARASVLR